MTDEQIKESAYIVALNIQRELPDCTLADLSLILRRVERAFWIAAMEKHPINRDNFHV